MAIVEPTMLIDRGTSFLILADQIWPMADEGKPSVVVTCRYCGNRYADPVVLRCVDGCGAALPPPPLWRV